MFTVEEIIMTKELTVISQAQQQKHKQHKKTGFVKLKMHAQNGTPRW